MVWVLVVSLSFSLLPLEGWTHKLFPVHCPGSPVGLMVLEVRERALWNGICVRAGRESDGNRGVEAKVILYRVTCRGHHENEPVRCLFPILVGSDETNPVENRLVVSDDLPTKLRKRGDKKNENGSRYATYTDLRDGMCCRVKLRVGSMSNKRDLGTRSSSHFHRDLTPRRVQFPVRASSSTLTNRRSHVFI
jgi:hypothetical protein